MAFTFSRENSRGKTWYVGYYVNGRLIRKRIGRSKVLADKAKGDIEAKLERGEAGLLRKDYPVRKFFNLYLERTKGVHSSSYHNRSERVIRQFERFLDSDRPYLTKLSQVTPEVVEAYQRFRMQEVTPHGKTPIKKRTINLEVSSLRTFLNKACRWDLLSPNPLDKLEYLKENDSKVIRALTEQEVRKLLEAAGGWFRPILMTALYAGLREGELISLTWDDIDFDNCVIHIRRKPDWVPKSSGKAVRERDVAIPRTLVDFLRAHKNGSGKDPGNRVFCNKDGKMLKPSLRKVLMRLTAKCGFPEVTQFHALRHTYATHLIKASKDLTVARDQLGHADIRTTMRYSDLTMDRKRAAAQMLDYGTEKKA